MKAKKLIALFLAMAMIVSLAACSSSSSDSTSSDASADSTDDTEEETTASEPVYGGSVTLYYTSDIDVNFDPTIGDNQGYNLWMETLFTYDVNMSWDGDYTCIDTSYDYTYMTGQLASGWEWDEENGVLTVYIRDDVYYQDKEPYNGRQFVASDVKWSYDRTLGIGSGYDEPYEATEDWSSYLSYIEYIECPDDFTVEFYFYEDQANEVNLAQFFTVYLSCIGPEWDELTDEQKSDPDYACGTGPYILESITAGESVTLVKNENYYGTDTRAGYEGNQLPYIDEITFVYVSDSTNAATQFISGDIDFVGGRTTVFSDSEIAQIDASGIEYYTHSNLSSRTEIIMLRCNCEPFSDINVRKALQYAIDVEAIMTDYYDQEYELVGFLSSNLSYAWEWTEEMIEEYTYNPDKAVELLEEAGYSDGMEFTVVVSSDNDSDLFYYVASTYLAEVGITMNIEVVDSFMEAKTIGNDETDTRSTAGTGLTGTTPRIGDAGAKTYTYDDQWGSAIWCSDETWEAMCEAADASTTLEEFYEANTELDEYFLAQHWTCRLSSPKILTEFYSSRLQGMADGDALYDPTLMATFLMNMWVSE